MTTPGIIRKADLIRAAEAAKRTGCRIEIKIGDTLITIFPDEEKRRDSAIDRGDSGISYGKPVM
jgi:hypothetical protein